jgi:glycosyltransferase involved in cell wall biosynthesis
MTLSVVMPVHNASPFVDAAVRSVLSQTFEDFEFVILDDGSTDGSTGLLRRWARADSRIRLHENARPSGLVGSSNQVAGLATRPLVAPMDADDISHPRRLEAQRAVMEGHPEAALVGSLWTGIDADGRRVRPADRGSLRAPRSDPPFAHGSIMVRRRAFERSGGYRQGTEGWEEQDLFDRLRREGSLLVVAEALYGYRFHGGSTVEQSVAAWRDRRAALDPTVDEVASDVQALRFVAQTRVWRGDPPGLVRHALSMLGRRPGRSTVAAALVCLAGTTSPRVARAALAAGIRVRDARAGRTGIMRGGVYEWVVPEVPPPDR